MNRIKAFRFLTRFIKSEKGAAAAEYALILAIVGTAIAAASIFLGTAIEGAITAAADCISGVDVTCR